MYGGHAKQAGLIASQCHGGAYTNRWTIVVDDDIDPSNMFDVMWAMSTRCDPPEDIQFIKRSWSTPLDPLLFAPPWQNNRAVVDACRPWGMKDKFPRVAEASPELKEKVRRLGAPPSPRSDSGPACSAAGVLEDALSALVNLGYKESQARKVLEAMDITAATSVEEALKGALKVLVK